MFSILCPSAWFIIVGRCGMWVMAYTCHRSARPTTKSCMAFFPAGGGVRTPCKTHRKTHRNIPRCFDPVFASDDPSRVPVILPAARVGCPYTDNPSRVPVILPAARVGCPYTDDPSRVPVILPAARVGCPYTDNPSRLPVILPAARVGCPYRDTTHPETHEEKS